MNFVFVVVCPFPYGFASSMRARNLCKLLNMCGHSVHVIADYGSHDTEVPYCTYENLFQEQLPIVRRGLIPKACKNAVTRYCEAHHVDVILSNARYDRYAFLADICKRNGYRCIFESCEWYDKSSFKFGALDLRYLRNEMMLKRGFSRGDGFISISRLLHEHNQSFGKPSVLIPTILDVKNQAYASGTDRDKIILVYTGNPGKSKELILPVLKSLSEHETLRERIEFHIYGADRGKILRNIGGKSELLSGLQDCVFIHGNIPQDRIADVLMNADYQIFLRPNRRSSNAGFPTKLGESMAVGTPVIANDTGDIGLYLKDGINGFLLDGCETENVAGALHKAVGLSPDACRCLRENARRTAEESFDYRDYQDDVKKLLSR